MINVVFSLCLGNNYELNWSILFLIPVLAFAVVALYVTIKDYKEKKNTRIDFKIRSLNQDIDTYELKSIKNLEYIAYTRGSSGGHSYTLSAILYDGTPLELIRTNDEKKAIKLHRILRDKLNVQTFKTTSKGLFGDETTILN